MYQNRAGPTPGLVLLIGAAESKEDLKPSLRRCFTHTVEVEGPDESRRLLLLFHFLGLTTTEQVEAAFSLHDLMVPKVLTRYLSFDSYYSLLIAIRSLEKLVDLGIFSPVFLRMRS